MGDAQSITEVLGRFVADLRSHEIPERVIERAKISLIHNLCVALASVDRERVARDYATRWQAAPAQCTLLGTGDRVSAEGAALANAALIHARSQDDTHAGSSSHPGAPVIAAALAVAEAEAASGREFLDAVVLGYEVLCRVGCDFDTRISARGFRSAAVVGAFGAAAAAARLMRLDRAQTAAAIGFAAHQAGGLAQVWAEGSDEFPLQLGQAARNGLVAARLAAVGLQPATRGLEGRAGFYRAYADADQPPIEVLAGLGETWQLDEVTTKPFPACAILQGPLDLLLSMLRGGAAGRGLPLDVALVLHPFEADFTGIDTTDTDLPSVAAAKMSARFCLASMLVHGRLGMAELENRADPRVRALMSRIRVLRDPGLQLRQCRLNLNWADGQARAGEVIEPVGRPDLSAIIRFATDMAPQIGWSLDHARRLTEAVTGLGSASSVSPLLRASLTRASPGAGGRGAGGDRWQR